MPLIKPLVVIAAGAGLAFVLAMAAFLAVFASFGYPIQQWGPVEGTRMILVVVAVILVHLLWVVTWCVWRRLGWARFVAAALLVPIAGVLTWWTVAAAREMLAWGNEWAWGRELLTQEPTGRIAIFIPMILAPAAVVAISVLVTVLVPSRDPPGVDVRPAGVGPADAPARHRDHRGGARYCRVDRDRGLHAPGDGRCHLIRPRAKGASHRAA